MFLYFGINSKSKTAINMQHYADTLLYINNFDRLTNPDRETLNPELTAVN